MLNFAVMCKLANTHVHSHAVFAHALTWPIYFFPYLSCTVIMNSIWSPGKLLYSYTCKFDSFSRVTGFLRISLSSIRFHAILQGFLAILKCLDNLNFKKGVGINLTYKVP